MTTTIYFFNNARKRPFLELQRSPDNIHRIPFQQADHQRNCWRVETELAQQAQLKFRIDLGNYTYAFPQFGDSYDWYETPLRTVWVQRGQLFAYEPPPALSLPRVVKIPHFTGNSRFPPRSLYVYLPRGYDQQPRKKYPVIYMHDGQNCFESWVQDSYAGSWKADEAADRLIAAGQIPDCLIVGISNGQHARLAEYLPPFSTYTPPAAADGMPMTPIHGKAGETAVYYIHHVAPFIEAYYRAASDRTQRATCGSSLGGLFSTYLAWEHSHFAYSHAALSPSYWITAINTNKLEMVDRLRHNRPRNIRLWLDSGTQSESGDDGKNNTIAARDALLQNGYTLNKNLGYYLHEGAGHNENAWAERLPRVLKFLLPFTSN
ncbi:MAG: alpha/beta hydrolase-fold protein [Chloroflexota bacterium]